MPKYSIIVPLYNRPEEIDELLDSLTRSTFKDFEVVVVEDGSRPEMQSEEIVNSYRDRLAIQYHFKPNSGPGLTRNYGFAKGQGEWLITFDSDIIVPEDYLQIVDDYLKAHPEIDCYGGPDAAHESFSPLNKAISYSMTGLLTTGGIRGKKRQAAGQYHPRGFNMGFRFEVFKATGGFNANRVGEDIDLSIRVLEKGYKIALIPDALVYHKRRTNLKAFYRQVFNFGQARWWLHKTYPNSLKLAHLFPSAISLYILSIPVAMLLVFVLNLPYWLAAAYVAPLLLYVLANMIAGGLEYGGFRVGVLSGCTAIIQMLGYGLGFINYTFRRAVLGKQDIRLK
ncbi:MAG: glycosyltransferase [Bacteroidota bacterium]